MEDLGGMGMGQGQHGAQGRLAEHCGAHGAEKLGTELSVVASADVLPVPWEQRRDLLQRSRHLSSVICQGDNSEAVVPSS